MPKVSHEFRDPVHGFIPVLTDERRVIDSRPVQRLRHIHQLAMTGMVYPGATHTRFEHSLGVMHLAGMVFDSITNQANITDDVRDILPELSIDGTRHYWRQVVRMAALCHDVGHLPFSHGPEELLPEGWEHERLSKEHIISDEMCAIWHDMTPPLRPEDVVRVALERSQDNEPSVWVDILSEIITGPAFGVDRMDYLLRDSLHAGVAYGRFDHLRILGTLRILRQPPMGPGKEESSSEPAIGIERGGLEAAESLAVARYLMFSQLYFHKIRRIYDIHLMDFLRDWLEGGKFPVDLEKHLLMTDNHVFCAMESAWRKSLPGSDSARRILHRDHFKVAYELSPADISKAPNAFELISEAAVDEFGMEVRIDRPFKPSPGIDFPVQISDGSVASSLSLSQVAPCGALRTFRNYLQQSGTKGRSEGLDRQ